MHATNLPVYQTAQIREMERLAAMRFGVTGWDMMQRAGDAAFEFQLCRFPCAKKIAVFCGGGNNGGDGYVLAKLAHEKHLDVTVWQVGHQDNMPLEAANAFQAAKACGVKIKVFNNKANLENTDLIVDAICGIGLQKPLRDAAAVAVQQINQTGIPVFAIDIPTGINADTGNKLGQAIHAVATMTFLGLKVGLLTGDGIALAGDLACDQLQLPSELFDVISPVAEKLNLQAYMPFLKPRSRDWHKGLSGHVLVVGGALGFSGAARMAAEAALRVGAGLVSIATREEHAPVLNVDRPEIMCHGVKTAQQLAPLLAKATVVILGPGLGQSDWSKTLWQAVFEANKPLVVDADGLNILSATPKTYENWLLTPHVGEASRLLQKPIPAIQADRLAAAHAIVSQFGGVCVLKGAGSIVESVHSLPGICDQGNPGMATAGMGDVLSGVLGGLMAQGVPLVDAAKLGVLLHAVAGDLAAKQEGQRGLLAMDLMPYLRQLTNNYES